MMLCADIYVLDFPCRKHKTRLKYFHLEETYNYLAQMPGHFRAEEKFKHIFEVHLYVFSSSGILFSMFLL